jgi:AcrR family transcriptional regulator
LATDGKRRIRRDPEVTRQLILDAAERVMVDEGYAAVSSRRIGQELGLNPATVHYYFPTTDDLFIALHRRMTDRQLDQLKDVVTAEDPLAAYWEFQSGWAQTALGVEFLALSNHRKGIRTTLAEATSRAREAQTNALEAAVSRLCIDDQILPPRALVTILVAIGRLLANEERVGITEGHEEVRSVVRWALKQVSE